MLSITEALRQIKNAVLGRDVRTAIHDGIQQCYNYNTDIKEDLLTAVTKFKTLTETQTVHSSVQTGPTPTYIAMATFTVPEGSTAVEASYYVASNGGYWSKENLTVSTAGTTISALLNPAEADTDYLFRLVYNVNNPDIISHEDELEDIRVGEDGTEYSTAGEAVRTQIGDLKDDFSIISKPTRNLFAPKELEYTQMGAHFETDGNTLKMIANNGNGYLYVKFFLNVSTVDAVTISCGDMSGTGSGVLRIGKSTDKTDNTWINFVVANGSLTVDTSAITYLVIAVYAVYEENRGAGNYIEYSNIQIEYGSTATEYVPPHTAYDIDAEEELTQIRETFSKSISNLENIVSQGSFSQASSGIVKEITVSAGEKYRVYSYNNVGMINANNPVLYFIFTDNSYQTVTFRDINGTRYWECTTPDNIKSLRLFANKASSADAVSCEYVFIKDIGTIGDTTNTRLNAVETKTKLSFNRTTCKIFKKVVCCGDSYTSGHIQLTGEPEAATVNEEFAWPHYMSTLTGNEWINCGCSGCNVLTWQVHARGLPKARAAGTVQAYVIGLMINDQSDSTRHVDLGTVDDIGTDAQTYYGGMSKIIRELNAISPKAKIFVNTCPQTGENFPAYNQAVKDIVNAYKNTYPVFCIDLLANKDLYDMTSLTRDRVQGHYTALGYEQFAELYAWILSDYINSNVKKFQNVHEIPYTE